MAQPNVQGAARFRFERELADTLQGRIYSGTDLITNKPCVIKEAWRQLVHSGRSRKNHRVPEDFLRERRLMMELTNRADSTPGTHMHTSPPPRVQLPTSPPSPHSRILAHSLALLQAS